MCLILLIAIKIIFDALRIFCFERSQKLYMILFLYFMWISQEINRLHIIYIHILYIFFVILFFQLIISYSQMSHVVDACCQFLREQLEACNAIGIATFAQQHGCMELYGVANVFLVQHFPEVNILTYIISFIYVWIFI